MKRKIIWIIVVISIVALAVASYFLFFDDDAPLEIGGGSEEQNYIYVEGLIGHFQRLNPILEHLNPADRDVNRLIYNGLVKFDQWGNPVPDLVEAWNVSLKGDVFNITLREGVVWHDGMPLTTEDVAFTIELMQNPEIPVEEDIANLWSEVEVIVFDELNMQFILPSPFIAFADYLSFGVLPAHVLTGRTADEIVNGDFNFAPIGTGPYKFVDLMVTNDNITGLELELNEEYFGEIGEVKYVNFRYFDNHISAFAAYQNGDIFGISSIHIEIFDETFADPELNVYSAMCPDMRIIVLNHERDSAPYFKDAALRQALYYGLNRDNIIGEVLNGQAVKANGPMFPNSWAYYGNVESYSFNPNAAEELLESNGYLIPSGGGQIREKDGVPISFELVYQDTVEHETTAQMIKTYWGNLGINVNLIAVDQEALMDNYLSTGNYDAALIDLSLGSTADPDPYNFWHQAEANDGQNYSNWDDRRGSEYLERARVTPNKQERERQYRNFQIHFSIELPGLPLYYPVYSYAVIDELAGINLGTIFSSSDRFNNIANWYWDFDPVEEPTPTFGTEE